MNCAVFILLLSTCFCGAQTLLWDHADTAHTSFVIRRTSNIRQHYTNWPVVATVHCTNRWKIPIQTNKVHLFTVQASNSYGLSDPPTCGVWRAQVTPPRTYTAAQVGQVVRTLTASAPVKPPPLPAP